MFTAERPGATLQRDLPREVVPPPQLRLLLPERSREHAPPEEEEAGQVVLHSSRAWTETWLSNMAAPVPETCLMLS